MPITIVFRDFYFHVVDRFQKHGARIQKGLLEHFPSRNLEGDILGIHRVFLAVIHDGLDIHDPASCQRTIIQNLFDAFLDGWDENTGKPLPETLNSLGLDYTVPHLK